MKCQLIWTKYTRLFTLMRIENGTFSRGSIVVEPTAFAFDNRDPRFESQLIIILVNTMKIFKPISIK